MEIQQVRNDEELCGLIYTTLESKKDPFTLAELMQDVTSNAAFNKFCSSTLLKLQIAEVISSALECKVIEYYPNHPFVSKKFRVV